MKKKKRFIRITAVLFAAALAMPATSYAKEAERISGKIHHIHTGSPEEGGVFSLRFIMSTGETKEAENVIKKR